MKLKHLLFTTLAFIGIANTSQAQVPNYVPSNGLVGWWPFNGNANDESGNNLNGTNLGAALTTDRNGVNNASYDFTFSNAGWGTQNNEVFIQDSPTLDVNQITVSVWLYPRAYYWTGDSGNPNSIVLSRFQNGYSNPNGQVWGISFNQTSVTGSILAPNGTTGSSAISNNVIALNQWHNIVLTYDLSNIKLYIDGLLSATQSNNVAMNTSGNSGISIGESNQANGYWGYTNGKIDDIGIWNRALTEQEIQALYTSCNITSSIIAGNLSPATLTSATYACNNNAGSTYQWTVTNGVITDGQGTSNVTVLWGEEGVGTLSVVETNTTGCSGNPSTLTVDVICSSTATLITGPLGPNALTPTTYSCDGNTGSTYQWTISNGVITAGQGSNTVSVLWAGTGLGSISVQETTSANCQGDTISADVVVIPTGLDEVEKSAFNVFPNPANEIIHLNFAAKTNAAVTVSVTDLSGRLVMTSNANTVVAGKNTLSINTSALQTGMYFITLSDGKSQQSFRVSVSK